MEFTTANPPIARRTVSAKLRYIFATKPKVTTASASGSFSFPSRIPTRRKRDHSEVGRDENDATPAADSRVHVRQRVGSDASIASVETIRPDYVLPTASRCRTSSMISAKAVDVARHAIERAAPTPASPHVSPERPASPKPVLAGTTCHNQTRNENAQESGAEATCPPAYDGQPVPSEEPVDKVDASRSISSSTRPSRPLTRTRSYRKLASPVENGSPAPPILTEECPAATIICPTEPSPESTESCPNLSIDMEALSAMDEDVIRRVVASIVASAEEGERASQLDALPDIPDEQMESSFLDHEDEDEIPSLLNDRHSIASAAQPAYDARLELERFHICLKPKQRQAVLWDLEHSDFYAWQGLLYITDAHPPPVTASMQMPIQRLEIEWRSVNVGETAGAPFDDDDDTPCTRAPDHVATYAGQALRRGQVAARLDPRKGICTEPRWRHVSAAQTGAGVGAVWALRFWVPVPMALFAGRESRLFRVRARVAFGGWDIPWVVGHSAAVDVSIDLLQQARVMGGAVPPAA